MGEDGVGGGGKWGGWVGGGGRWDGLQPGGRVGLQLEVGYTFQQYCLEYL